MSKSALKRLFYEIVYSLVQIGELFLIENKVVSQHHTLIYFQLVHCSYYIHIFALYCIKYYTV